MAIEPSIQKTLRRWYLARLRKAAHEELAGQESTPATLISVDRDLIRILTGSPAPPTDVEKRLETLTRATKESLRSAYWIVGLSVIGHIVIMVCVLR